MNFFKNLAISSLIITLYGLQVSMSLKAYKSIKLGIECTNFFYQILCLQMSVLIIHGYCFHVSYAMRNLSEKIICIKQNARLLSEEFSEHPRDAEIKSIYNVFMITSLWLLFAIAAHVTSVPYLIRVTYGITIFKLY